MNNNHVKPSDKPYTVLLLTVALLGALLFNGAGNHAYFLSMSWLALFLMFLYQFSQNVEIRIPIDLPLTVVVLFVLWMLLSLYWHPVEWTGIFYNWRIGAYFFALVAAYYLLKEKDVAQVFRALAAVGVATAALTIYQSLWLEQSADGFFSNRNNNAAFLNLFILPLMSLLLFNDNNWQQKLPKSAALLLLFLAVLEIFSRGALIGLALAGALLYFFALSERKTKNILHVTVIFLLALFVHTLFSDVEVKSHVESHSRWLLWGSTIEMIKDANWTGIGNGMFPMLYPEYRHADEASGGFFVHNDYLQILLELGIPGFALLVLLIGIVIFKARVLIQKGRDYRDVAIYMGFFAAILAVAIHSLVTFNFYKASILIVLGLYTGFLLNRASYTDTATQRIYSFKVTGKAISAVAVIVLVSAKSIMLIGYTTAVSSGIIGNELESSTPEERYLIYKKLWNLDKTNYIYPLSMAVFHSKTDEDEGVEQRKLRFQQSRALIHQARELNPHTFDTYMHEIGLLEGYKDVLGDIWKGEAITLALKALDMEPRLKGIRMRAAMLMASEGDNERALALLQGGIVHLRSGSLKYYEYGKQLAEELGNDYAVRQFVSLIKAKKAQDKMEFNEMVEEYKAKAGLS